MDKIDRNKEKDPDNYERGKDSGKLGLSDEERKLGIKSSTIGYQTQPKASSSISERIADETSTIDVAPFADSNSITGAVRLDEVGQSLPSNVDTVKTNQDLTFNHALAEVVIKQRPDLSPGNVIDIVNAILASQAMVARPNQNRGYEGSNPSNALSYERGVDVGVRTAGISNVQVASKDPSFSGNISLNVNGAILEQVKIATGSVAISTLPSWHKAITIVAKPDLNSLLNLAEISEDGHTPFLTIKCNVIGNLVKKEIAGAEPKMRYLLDRAGVMMSDPISLITYELSDVLVSKCTVFSSLGKLVCGMPLAQESMISTQLRVNIDKYAVSPKTSVDLNGGQLITGILLFALDACEEFRKVVLDKSVTLLFDTSIVSLPIVFKGSVVLSKSRTHPFFSIISPQVMGLTRESIIEGGEFYGAMPIGRDSVLERVLGSPTKELHWNAVDNLSAILYSMSFSNANQNSVDINEIILGMKACDFFAGTFKHHSLADTKPPMGYRRIKHADRVGFILNLSYNTNAIRNSFLRIYNVISEINMFVEVVNKVTYLGSCLTSMLQTSPGTVAFMDRNARSGTLSGLLYAVTFLYAPEVFWLEITVPPPNSVEQAILTLYAIMTFLLFFPKCAKYSIHTVHNGLYEACHKLGLPVESFSWITDRTDNNYHCTTESDINKWTKFGLKSEFFNPNLTRYQNSPTLKEIVKTLSSISVLNPIIQDTRAQAAGFPRLRGTRPALTNGGLIPPWPRAERFRSQTSLSIQHSNIKESILKITPKFQLKNTEVTAIKNIITALSNDITRSIYALTFIPPRLLCNIVDLPVSVFYQWDGKFYSPLPSIPVLYDQLLPETYQPMFINIAEETPYDIFLPWHLTQNMSIIFEGDDKPAANDVLLTIEPIDPIALYCDQISFVREASPLITICGALSWLLDMVVNDRPVNPSPFGHLFTKFGYYLRSGISPGVYQSFVNQLTTVLRRRTVFDNENTKNLYSTFFSVTTDNTLLRIRKPAIGQLLSGAVQPFSFPVIDVTYNSYFDPVYKEQVELIMDMFINPSSLVCRCSSGLYICDNTWDDLDFRSFYEPSGSEVVPSENMVAYQTRAGLTNLREVVFNDSGVLISQPDNYPKKTFKIPPDMHFSENLLSILSQGFKAKKFSFLLTDINYIWEVSQLASTDLPYNLSTLLSYDRNQLFEIRFPDYTQVMYYSPVIATIQPRSYVPTKSIFNYVIGSGFDAEGQRVDSIPLKTSSMESGFKIDTFFTGYMDDSVDPPVQRKKPPISESMFNLVPSVTGKVAYSLTDQIQYTVRENQVHDWRLNE